MKRKNVELFEKLNAQLEGLYQELSLLAKKSPNDAVNAFKLQLVNSTLKQTNSLLGDKYKPFAMFAEFATDDLPTNSDVTFIISQYLKCAEELRSDNIENHYSRGWFWTIDGEEDAEREGVPTAPPKKLDR